MDLKDLLKKETPPDTIELSQDDLKKFFYKLKGLEKDLERERAYWESTNKNLEKAYKKLNEKENQLQESLALLRKTQEEVVQQRYRTLVETIPYGIIENDLNGSILFCNRALKNILGYEDDEIVGKKAWDVLSNPAKKDKSIVNFKKTIEKALPEGSFTLNCKTKNGNSVNLLIDWSYRRGYNNEITGIISVVTDITEKLKIEDEKNTLISRLQQTQRMESLGKLAGGIAHDFNNLLTGILGNIYLLLMEVETTHPFHDKLKKIEQIAISGADLIRQILFFSRGENVEKKLLSIKEIIEDVFTIIGRTKKDIVIKKYCQEDIWSVEADQGQIEQVLLNLYVNAIQAMEESGKIAINAKNVILEKEFVDVYFIDPGKFVCISVTDNGIGMDKEIVDRIFEPFFTTKSKEKGSGLGMAIAYSIIKKHGGIINVYSEKGKGTTFNVYLPATEKKYIADSGGKGSMLKGTETILIVDDEDIVIDVGEKCLKMLGYTVITGSGGKEAIAIYKEKMDQIELVILDCIMPGMSADEIVEGLKLLNRDVKILLSSGYGLNSDIQETLEKGCLGFIQKPFCISDLSIKIREAFDADKNN